MRRMYETFVSLGLLVSETKVSYAMRTRNFCVSIACFFTLTWGWTLLVSETKVSYAMCTRNFGVFLLHASSSSHKSGTHLLASQRSHTPCTWEIYVYFRCMFLHPHMRVDPKVNPTWVQPHVRAKKHATETHNN